MPKQYSEELNSIIKSMLENNPTDRPSASKILRHPYVKKHIALFLEGTKSRLVDIVIHVLTGGRIFSINKKNGEEKKFVERFLIVG